MWSYLARRLLQTFPVLLGVALITFALSEMSGTAIREMLGARASPEVKARLEKYYGLDRPWYERFQAYVWRLTHADLGVSITNQGESVSKMIWSGMQVTFKLALGALLVATYFGIIAGIAAAWRPNSALDYTASAGAALGVSFPAFFLAMLLLLLFSVNLKLLPIGGYNDGDVRYLVLPCVSLGLISTASISRLTRSCMLETLGADYVRTGRSKGVGEATVLLSHAFPNAMVPVVTVIGADFAGLLSGAVLTETVFGLPGMGSVIYKAIFERDLPTVMGCCIVFALIFIVANLIVDLSYALLDPRIRYGD